MALLCILPLLYFQILHPRFFRIINLSSSNGSLANTVGPQKNETFITMHPSTYNRRRTGNQIFNMASLLYFSKKTNRTIFMPRVIPDSVGWLDTMFDLDILRVDHYSTAFCPCHTLVEPHGGMMFHSFVDNQTGSNLYETNATTLFLVGYFQSWKYLVSIENELRRLLVWRPEISQAVDQFWKYNVTQETCRNSSCFRVGIHVRRGDFSEHVSNGFAIADSKYLRNAIQYFVDARRSKYSSYHLVFVVCSDDIPWVKSTIATFDIFNQMGTVHFIFSENQQPGFDLRLLSTCDANIITVGTFGWWAAWLAKTTTIYYKNYPRLGSEFASGYSQEDYYMPAWIPME